MDDLHWEPLSRKISVLVSREHHFSTDTILLAWFSRPKPGSRCADLGSGCGAIPLLWCRDKPPARIFAVELQENACRQMRESIDRNGLSDIISAEHRDIRDLDSVKGDPLWQNLDLVACNPPYKAPGTGIPNPEESLRTARHEESCTMDDILRAARMLLRTGGWFCLCQRPERLCDVLAGMRSFDLEPKRLRFVHQRPGSAPSLFLAGGIRGGRPGGLAVEPPLFIESPDGGDSDDMKQIYGDYREIRA